VQYHNPANTDAMLAWEYGGYRVPKGSIIGDFDTLSRSAVLARQKDGTTYR
jgi:hypothetical protein